MGFICSGNHGIAGPEACFSDHQDHLRLTGRLYHDTRRKKQSREGVVLGNQRLYICAHQ